MAPDEARRLGRKLLAIAYVLMLGTNLLVYIFLPQLFSGLYGLTAETTAVVHDLLLWHSILPRCSTRPVLHPLRRCALPEIALPHGHQRRRCWSFASG